MESIDQERFKIILAGVCEIYSKRISPQLIQMYWQSLKPVTIDQFDSAVQKHMLDPKNGRFFPIPADIMRNIDGQQQTTEDRAMLAWMEVERSISRIGAYGSINLEDKQALMAIKNMGSWQQLCHTDRDKLGFKRQEFMANYKALENTPIESLPNSLAGIEELSNQRLGVDSPADNLLKQLEERETNKINQLENENGNRSN